LRIILEKDHDRQAFNNEAKETVSSFPQSEMLIFSTAMDCH
jgi:hypothetical protein